MKSSKNSMKQDFDDIRDYDDHEVNGVLLSLLKDSEFLQFLAQQKFPRLQRLFPTLIQRRIKKTMMHQFKNVHSVQAMQNKLTPLVRSLMDRTVTEFKVTGLEQLDKNSSYVFISNHRDIAMDPMLVNYALLNAGLASCKIAIGDNLLERQFVAKLMRLNKSFVVQRSPGSRKDKLAAVNKLSAYIHHSVKRGQSIWIAQKEGRAKDGKDMTDTAVLKMLHMAGRKAGWEFKESMNYLKLVPVSISYEWDPCDEDKARELDAQRRQGCYEKSKDEDLLSIIKGIKGQKGRVSVHFSAPLSQDSNTADQWSKAIDHEIHSHYDVFDNHLQAQALVSGGGEGDDAMWQKKYGHLPKPVYQQIIETYAQPAISQAAAKHYD